MSDLAPEKRAELRAAVEERHLFRFATERGSDGYPSSGLLEIGKEVLALLDERDRLAAAAERIRALHERDGEGFCVVCDYMTPHPCPTLRALDGTDE